MSFPAYPNYKDSGIEWLGPVPAHWEVCPPKRRMRSAAGGTLIKGQCANEPSEGLFPGFSASGQDVWLVSADYETRGLVLSAVGARCGKTFKADGAWGVVANTHCLFPLSNADRDFLWYITNDESWWEKGGSAQPFIKTSETLARAWVFPPLPEQTRIAEFLDRETAKIDELVAEQRRLMELLKEKRQAVISHAVTRGLNPAAPLKPSGIDWFGEVPAHWNLGLKLKNFAIRRAAAFTNGPFGSDLLTSELQDEGVPVIYIRDLKPGRYVRTSNSYVTPQKATELDKFRVDSGDVLFAKVGDPPGYACKYPSDEPTGVVCQDVIRLKPDLSIVDSDYVCFLINSRPGIEAIDSVCVELTRKRFSLEDLHSLRMPIPPRAEQIEIASYLNAQGSKFDALTAEAQRAVDLLQERRTALISAAVTGRIDVRAAA